MIIPNSDIYLLKCPLEEDNLNQITFNNATTQFEYFNSLPKLQLENAMYQRKDDRIAWPGLIDNIINYNYCMYRNTNYSNKWFYAYITNMTYENNNCTYINIKTDVFQTWQFDITFQTSFIARQHTSDDTLGAYCEPEPIIVQAYPVDKTGLGSSKNVGVTNQNIILYFTKPPSSISVERVGFNSGALSGQYGHIYRNVSELNIDLDILESNGEMDLINDVGIGFFGDLTVTQDSLETVDFVSPPFEPKNRKTLTYCYGRVLGTTDFKVTVQQLQKRYFEYYSECWWGSSPFAYVQIRDIPNTVVEYTAFPTANVAISTFENGVNHALNEMNNLSKSKILGDIAMSAVNGQNFAETGLKSLTKNNLEKIQLYEQKKNDSLEPDTMSGFKASTAVFNAGYGGIYLIRYAPKIEQFHRIDDFFTMFGYAINRVIPVKFTNRPYWDYIKTVDINLDGNAPQDDLQEIKDIFNNGVTIWHNPNNIGNYSLDNSV